MLICPGADRISTDSDSDMTEMLLNMSHTSSADVLAVQCVLILAHSKVTIPHVLFTLNNQQNYVYIFTLEL